MKDHVIVLTGASSGIGAAFAQLAGGHEAKLVLVARRQAQLAAVAANCGANVEIVVGDVTKRDDMRRAFDAAIARFGRVDVWINNAGRGISRMPSEVTDDDLDEMMLVNVKSAIYGIQAVLPHFKARGSGQIINISSMLGRIPLAPIRSAYVAAKHALDGYTGTLRIELAVSHPGIVVSTVHPGVVATEFGVSARNGGPDSRQLPNAQSPQAVAQVIAETIEHKRVDVYTIPGGQKLVVGYYSAEDMATVERGFLPIPART